MSATFHVKVVALASENIRTVIATLECFTKLMSFNVKVTSDVSVHQYRLELAPIVFALRRIKDFSNLFGAATTNMCLGHLSHLFDVQTEVKNIHSVVALIQTL